MKNVDQPWPWYSRGRRARRRGAYYDVQQLAWEGQGAWFEWRSLLRGGSYTEARRLFPGLPVPAEVTAAASRELDHAGQA